MANPTVTIETNHGTIRAEMFVDKAPKTAGNFIELAKKGFYDGVIFHRVIDGFMIQGGDPTGTGRGGPGYQIDDEFGPGLAHTQPGLFSMANAGPDTGGSQFFITLAATPWLDRKHAIFGKVTSGLDVVKAIGKVATGPGDRPVEDVVMEKVTVSGDDVSRPRSGVSTTPPWEVDAWDLGPTWRRSASSGPRSARSSVTGRSTTCGLPPSRSGAAASRRVTSCSSRRRCRGPSRATWRTPRETRTAPTEHFTLAVLEAGGFARGRARSPSRLTRRAARMTTSRPCFRRSPERGRRSPRARRSSARCPARARHFVFGYLTSSEWVRMCAIHTAHHLAIVRDIRDG
jgi:cyclophilin family peptidyl-prolyl cis-trans isomerase